MTYVVIKKTKTKQNKTKQKLKQKLEHVVWFGLDNLRLKDDLVSYTLNACLTKTHIFCEKTKQNKTKSFNT